MGGSSSGILQLESECLMTRSHKGFLAVAGLVCSALLLMPHAALAQEIKDPEITGNDDRSINCRSIDAWIGDLKNENPKVRAVAAYVLSHRNLTTDDRSITLRAVAALRRALEDKDPRVRSRAAVSLWAPTRPAHPAPDPKPPVADLIFALQRDDNPRVRGVAAYALGRSGENPDAVVPALIGALKEDSAVRGEAAEALGKIGAKPKVVVPALIGALKDKNDGVRGVAARSLGQFGAKAQEAVPALIELYRKEPEADSDDWNAPKPNAAAALKKIDPAAAKKAGVP
jgi:HEAT repeat protein